MRLVLSEFGRSFATRERAHEILDATGVAEAAERILVLGDISVSPSFLAEFLGAIASSGKGAIVETNVEHHRYLASDLARKLNLNVAVRELASTP